MACGRIVRPFDTLGVFNSFSLNLRALGDGFFDTAAFAVMLRAFVDFLVDESEELGEVGGGPTLNPIKERNDSRHFCSQFTAENIRSRAARLARRKAQSCRPRDAN